MNFPFQLIEVDRTVAMTNRVTLADLKSLVAVLDSAGVTDKTTVFLDQDIADAINETRLDLLDDEDLNEGIALLEGILK